MLTTHEIDVLQQRCLLRRSDVRTLFDMAREAQAPSRVLIYLSTAHEALEHAHEELDELLVRAGRGRPTPRPQPIEP